MPSGEEPGVLGVQREPPLRVPAHPVQGEDREIGAVLIAGQAVTAGRATEPAGLAAGISPHGSRVRDRDTCALLKRLPPHERPWWGIMGRVSEDLFAYLPPYARDVCEKLLPLAEEKGFDPAGLPALLCLVMLQQAMLADQPAEVDP